MSTARLLLISFVALAIASAGTSAVAQDDAKSSQTLDTGEGLTISVAKGWRSAKAPKGAVALLKSQTDVRSQVEFRVADKMEKDKVVRYFSTFHTSLEKSGMERKSRNESVTYNGKKGAETEYELVSKNRKYRLIVWETYVGDRAWLAVGFFSADNRESLYTDFVGMLNTLEWTE